MISRGPITFSKMVFIAWDTSIKVIHSESSHAAIFAQEAKDQSRMICVGRDENFSIEVIHSHPVMYLFIFIRLSFFFPKNQPFLKKLLKNQPKMVF